MLAVNGGEQHVGSNSIDRQGPERSRNRVQSLFNHAKLSWESAY